MPDIKQPDLVYIDQHGILGSNFYWHRHESYGITRDEILATGLTNERVQVHPDLINPLQEIDAIFQKDGYRLYIREGYRSKELYELIYRKRITKFGREMTDRLVNMDDMPHATGMSVDIALWDVGANQLMLLRRFEDGPEALFLDFYKNKNDEASRRYQALQEYVIAVALDHGFRLGKKREYFHFNYRPEEPKSF